MPRSSAATPRQERIRVSQACENCRIKKSRCDGVTPVCGRCQLKSLDCHYGVTKRVQNQRKMKELATKVAQYESVLKKNIRPQAQLHNSEGIAKQQSPAPSSPAYSLSPSSLLEAASSLSPMAMLRLDTNLPDSPSIASVEEGSEAMPQFDIPSSQQNSWLSHHTKPTTKPPQELLERAMKSFLAGSALLFTVFDEEEIPALFDEIYGENRKSIGSTLALIQLCAAAAVGCQWYPKEFDSTSKLALLTIVKSNLEDCIEEVPLTAMCIMTLLSIYFTFEKRSAAVMYCGMALQLAKVHQTETLFYDYPSTPWQRVFGSLILLDCWLCANTGRMPSLRTYGMHRSICLTGSGNAPLNALIQSEMTKVATLSGSILEDIYYTRFVSTTTINKYNDRLQQWRVALPEYMRLDHLLNLQERTDLLRSVFLVHILYMTTVLLVYRRALVELARTREKWSDQKFSKSLQTFLEPCLWTGRQLAKILEIALSQDQILQNCWMFVNAAYITGSVMLYFCINRIVHSDLLDELSHDLNTAKNCLEVLKYCAEVNQESAEFLRNLSSIYDIVTQTQESVVTSMINDESPSGSRSHPERMQKTLSLTATLLIHPFEGGLKREVKFFQDAINEFDQNIDVDPSIKRGAFEFTEGPDNFFLHDFYFTKEYMSDISGHREGKEKEVSSVDMPHKPGNSIVFGS